MEGLNRRELLGAGAAAGAALVLPGAAAAGTWSRTLDFPALGDGDGWPGWTCSGVANLRRGYGRGVLEAASDVFPCDPRPVAFALDQRFRDGEIAAVIAAAGAGAGLVLRRIGPREYYAAIYDDEQGALIIVRRGPGGGEGPGRAAAGRPGAPLHMSFRATGSLLEATLGMTTVSARDTT